MDCLTIILFFHPSPSICFNDLDSSERDDNSTEKVTAQKEAARTLKPKYLSAFFQSHIWGNWDLSKHDLKWRLLKTQNLSYWQYWWSCSCHSTCHATYTVHLYLNCVHLFLQASLFVTLILLRKTFHHVSDWLLSHLAINLASATNMVLMYLPCNYYFSTQDYNKLKQNEPHGLQSQSKLKSYWDI